MLELFVVSRVVTQEMQLKFELTSLKTWFSIENGEISLVPAINSFNIL